MADVIYLEVYPTSPLIVSPFTDPLVVPQALKPVHGVGQQNSIGNERHQLWKPPGYTSYADPLVYEIKLEVNTHAFTTSKVLPINSKGKPTISFDAGAPYPAGTMRRYPIARSTDSTARSPDRASTPSMASRSSCGSRTTSTRIR